MSHPDLLTSRLDQAMANELPREFHRAPSRNFKRGSLRRKYNYADGPRVKIFYLEVILPLYLGRVFLSS
jgi:hypothetical protein